MALEGDPTSGTFYIDDLVATNPTSSDPKSQGDDQIRLVKKSIKNTFPNIDAPVTATAAELNYVDGVTSAIQTQFAAKAPLASPTFTGTVVLPSDTSIGDVSSTELAYVNGCTEAIQTRLTGLKAFDVVFTLNTVANGTYNVVLSTSFAFTVDSVVYDCGAGSVTANVRDDGTAIEDCGAISITTSGGTVTPSPTPTVAASSKIDIVLTSTSSCTGLIIQLKCTRT